MKDLFFIDTVVDGPYYAKNRVVKCTEVPTLYRNTKKIGDLTFCVNWSKGVLDYNVAQDAFLVEERYPQIGEFVFSPVEPHFQQVNEGNKHMFEDTYWLVIKATTHEELRFNGVSGIGTNFLKQFCEKFEGIETTQKMREEFIDNYRGEMGGSFKFFNEREIVREYTKEEMLKIFMELNDELQLNYTTALGVTVKLSEEVLRKHLASK